MASCMPLKLFCYTVLNPVPAKPQGLAGYYFVQWVHQISNPSILVGLAHKFLEKEGCTYSNDQILLDKADLTNATHSPVDCHN